MSTLQLTNFQGGFVPPREIGTLDSPTVSKNKGTPLLAEYCNGTTVYVSPFNLDKQTTDVIRKTSRSLGVTLTKRDPAFQKHKEVARTILTFIKQELSLKVTNITVWRLNDFKTIVTHLKKQKVKLPSGIHQYLNESCRFYDAGRYSKQDERQRMAQAVAGLWNKMAPADIITAAEGGTKLCLEHKSLSGEMISRRAKRIGLALKAIAYSTGITVENGIISVIHRFVSDLRQIKKAPTEFQKQCRDIKLSKEVLKEIGSFTSQYKSPSLDMVQDWVKTREDFEFDIPKNPSLGPLDPVATDLASFATSMGSSKHYYALVPLWSIHKDLRVKTWDQFVKFLLKKKAAVDWVRFLIASYAVAHRFAPDSKRSYVSPTLIANALEPVVELLLSLRKQMTGKAKAKYIALLLPLIVSHCFSTRKSILLTFNVLSERDYTHRLQLKDMPALFHGFYLVVTHDSYRVVIRQHKNRGMKGDRKKNDVDVTGTELEERFPLFLDMIPDIISAYETLTNQTIRYNTQEKRRYISSFSPTLDKYSGWYRVLKLHAFPLLTPVFKFGCKYFISPTAAIDGDSVYVNKSVDSILPLSLKQLKAWKNDGPMRLLHGTKIKISIDGTVSETSLGVTPLVNHPRVQLYTPLYAQNGSSETVPTMIKLLDEIWKGVIYQGEITLSEYYFGEGVAVTYRGPISEHLRIAASHCALTFEHCGRYSSGFMEIGLINKLLSSMHDPAISDLLITRKKKLVQAEDHVTESLIMSAYMPFKDEKLRDFQGLNGTYSHYQIERMSSHPNCRPSFTNIPRTFVQTKPHDGGLKMRCGNMEYLSPIEQNCNLYYLKQLWKKYEVFEWLSKYLSHPSDVFKAEQLSLIESMKKAQVRWDAKFGRPSLLTSVVQTVKSYLSPSK